MQTVVGDEPSETSTQMEGRQVSPFSGMQVKPRLTDAPARSPQAGGTSATFTWKRPSSRLLCLIGAKAPVISPALVVAATVATCVLYIDPARWVSADELVLYIVASVLVCLAALLFAAMQATPRDGNAKEYYELKNRLGELQAQLDALGTAQIDDHQNPVALAEARSDVIRFTCMLDSAGPEWASGNGYIGAWKLLHHAEEALLEVRPVTEVVAAGINDSLRLFGSTIEHSDQLTSKLYEAIETLSPESFHRYVAPPGSVTPLHTVSNAANAHASQPAASPGSASEQTEDKQCCPQCVARSILRNVRYAIDEYRDDVRAGLLRARNILLATLTFSTLGAYALAGTAVSHDAGRAFVGAGAAYFALGAIVGLFNRLRIASRTSNQDNPLDVEDYGLTWARAMAAPIFSGLAGVIGVFVFSQLQISVSGIGLVPAQAAQVLAGATGPPDISQVFNLHTNSFGLLIAAVFGTAPELLAGYLQKPAADLKKGLKSSASSGGKASS